MSLWSFIYSYSLLSGFEESERHLQRFGGWQVQSVPVSAGTDFIFFIVVGKMLCFGFKIRIMLITHWCLWTLLTQHQSLFSFLCCLGKKEVGCARSWGMHSQDSWCKPEWYSMPYEIMLSKKTGGIGQGDNCCPGTG